MPLSEPEPPYKHTPLGAPPSTYTHPDPEPTRRSDGRPASSTSRKDGSLRACGVGSEIGCACSAAVVVALGTAVPDGQQLLHRPRPAAGLCPTASVEETDDSVTIVT